MAETNLTERFERYLDYLEQVAEQGGDFVAQQAPLVVQEALRWELWNHLVLAVLCTIVVVFLFACKYAVAKKMIDAADDWHVPAIAVFAIANVFPVIFSVYHWLACLKVWVAPRLVILEKLSELL